MRRPSILIRSAVRQLARGAPLLTDVLAGGMAQVSVVFHGAGRSAGNGLPREPLAPGMTADAERLERWCLDLCLAKQSPSASGFGSAPSFRRAFAISAVGRECRTEKRAGRNASSRGVGDFGLYAAVHGTRERGGSI